MVRLYFSPLAGTVTAFRSKECSAFFDTTVTICTKALPGCNKSCWELFHAKKEFPDRFMYRRGGTSNPIPSVSTLRELQKSGVVPVIHISDITTMDEETMDESDTESDSEPEKESVARRKRLRAEIEISDSEDGENEKQREEERSASPTRKMGGKGLGGRLRNAWRVLRGDSEETRVSRRAEEK